MKRILLYSVCLLLLCSCGEEQQEPVSTPKSKTDTTPSDMPVQASFFPVSDYLLGQIILMKRGDINPLLKTHTDNKDDSTWIRMESIDSVLKDFTEPYIDSVRLSSYFKETKFEDASMNLITLSYDANNGTPVNVPWSHWDIYIDPESGEVKRIYLVKYLKNGQTQQLHCKPGDSWKIITLSGGTDAHVISEKTLLLKYNSR